MKTVQELIERMEADLAALKAMVLPKPEAPEEKPETKADHIRLFVAEAQETGKDRSWVIDQCVNKLDMSRSLAWRRLYDIWPTGRTKPKGQQGKWTANFGGEDIGCVHLEHTKFGPDRKPVRYVDHGIGGCRHMKKYTDLVNAIQRHKVVWVTNDVLKHDEAGNFQTFVRVGYYGMYEVKNFKILPNGGLEFDFGEPIVQIVK